VDLRLQAKVNAAKLVQALLEARQDLAIHKLLAKELEPAMLEMVRNYVTATLEAVEAKGSAGEADEQNERYKVVILVVHTTFPLPTIFIMAFIRFFKFIHE